MESHQRRFLARAADIGLLIQEEMPHVATLYREHNLLTEIARGQKITVRYGGNEDLAATALHFALFGHNKQFGPGQYKGMIPEEEQAGLRDAHRVQMGKKYTERKIGFHADNRAAQIAACKAAGRTSWYVPQHPRRKLPIEVEFAYGLTQLLTYQHPSGRPKMEKLSAELNRVYHKGKGFRKTKGVSRAVRLFVQNWLVQIEESKYAA